MMIAAWRFALALVSAGVLVMVTGAAQAAGTPISSCGLLVTSNAVLTQNLTCTGHGIRVGGDGVTIDLNGFVIRGDGDAGDYGIDNTGGYDKLTVKNGALRHFMRGIEARGDADRLSISNVVTSGNTDRGISVSGDFTSIKSSTASGNAWYGIYVTGDSALVQSTVASGNGSTGIYLEGDAPSVKSTTAAANPSYGIYLYGPSAAIQSSTACGNGRGIYVYGDGASIRSSDASGNTLYDGIRVDGNAASVKSSTASGNAKYGIQLDGDAASVRSSVASGNDERGIYVHGDAATIKGNKADGNGFPGGASDVAGLGILAEDYTTAPAGSNTARGNDDPAECSPASLC